MGNLIVTTPSKVGTRWKFEFLPPFNFGGNKLGGVSAGTGANDAINKSQLDLKVDKTETEWLLMEIDGENVVLAQNALNTIRVPYNCTITAITLISRETGATVAVDILTAATFAGVASISGTGTKPALSNAQTADQTTFTNWSTVNLDANAFLQAKVTTAAPTAVKQLTVLVKIARR